MLLPFERGIPQSLVQCGTIRASLAPDLLRTAVPAGSFDAVPAGYLQSRNRFFHDGTPNTIWS